MALRVFALAAHPDDIEFGMAGTLILMARAGCEIHYMNIANGSCGSNMHDAAATAEIRLAEATVAAGRISAVFHPPLVADLEIFYEPKLLARVASVMRAVAPDILLAPSPQDYIEDHENACRLAVTAAFCRGMPNFPVNPPRPATGGEIVVYHAQPHGNRDSLNHLVHPDFCVDITTVIEDKIAMLGEHKSQKTWLDQSQGMNAYLDIMKGHAAQIGALTSKSQFAEGWRRHNPLGFCAEHADPLADMLGDHIVDC